MSSEHQPNSFSTSATEERLSETRWQAWLAKGRATDSRRRVERNAAIRYAAVAVLLITAGVWSNLAGSDVFIRFAVTTAALFTATQAFRDSKYATAGAFVLIALLYNPVVPAFFFAGDWQRAFVIASALLFMTSGHLPTRQLART